MASIFHEPLVLKNKTVIPNPRVDSYIENSADFAKPVLEKIRKMVAVLCHEAVEDFKWSFPVFTYKGANICHMAAFKHHCSFGFWLASLMDDPKGILKIGAEKDSMGSLGKITSLEQLPSIETMRLFFVQAMDLIEKGVKLQKTPTNSSATLEISDDFQKAVLQNSTAEFHFSKMSPGKKREYAAWIDSAKTEKTRQNRLTTAIEWISEGKSLNWKYEQK